MFSWEYLSFYILQKLYSSSSLLIYAIVMYVFHPSIGRAQGLCPKPDPGIVPAPGELPEPAEGPGPSALQAQGHERRQPLPPGFSQTAAAAQWQHEVAGGLVRASTLGPVKEETDRGGRLEEEQGAGNRPEGPPGAPERWDAEARCAESLSGEQDLSDGAGEGGAPHTTQGSDVT